MDRGEDRDLLSSGFFDSSHDHLYNKRMMGNKSKNNRGRESEGVRGGEMTLLRRIQPYRCHVRQAKTTRVFHHLTPQTDDFINT